MVTTARSLVKRAMQRSGVLTKNEDPSADEIVDANNLLNIMLESWSNESLLVFANTWETFSVVAGDGDYTIGLSGDFNTSRPINIKAAYIRQDTTDYDLEIMDDITYNKYILNKLTESIPRFLNYQTTFPQGVIRLWPVPVTNYGLFILSEKPYSAFGLDDDISFPPGWEFALIENLAVLIAPEYGQQPDATIVNNARNLKKDLRNAIDQAKTSNTRITPVVGRYNIYTGVYN